MATDTPVKLFTLTPLSPLFKGNTQDESPYARAFVNFRNAHMLAFGGSDKTIPSLKTLADENWIYYSSTSAAPSHEDNECIQNWERSPIVEIAVQMVNVSSTSQILLRVRMVALGPHGRVRTAVKRRVVNTYNVLHNQETTISILVDTRGERDWVYADIKHIRQDNGEASALKVYEIAGFLT